MIKKSFLKAALLIGFLSSTSAFAHSAPDNKPDSIHDNAIVQNSFNQQILDLLQSYNNRNKSGHISREILMELIAHQKNITSGKLPSVDSNLPDNPSELYNNLLDVFSDIGKAEHIQRLLYAYKIARASAEERQIITNVLGKQVSLIGDLYNTDNLEEAIIKAKEYSKSGAYNTEQIRMIDAMYYDHVIHTAIPNELAVEFAQIRLEGRSKHKEWKKNNNSTEALKWLEKSFDIQRKVGQAVADKLGLETAYDGLLALFQPGYNSKKISEFYDNLIPKLKEITAKAIEKQGNNKPVLQDSDIDLKLQAELNKITTSIFGMDSSSVYLSASELESVEGGIKNNVMLVVKMKGRESDFTKSNRTAFHEYGHAFVIDGVPRILLFTPIGKLPGTAIEEGVAFIAEKGVSRSFEYAEYLAPIASNIFNKKINAADYYDYRTWVEPSLSRIAADEITYSVHTYIRTEIEKAVINKEMEVSDIPEKWNKFYKNLLGLDVPDNSKGFMIDVHWFVAKAGMFPFYTIGDAVAAQLMHKIKQDVPDIMEKVKSGDATDIVKWLNENAFQDGRFLDLDGFMINATGEKLNPKYMLEHLEQRYTDTAPKADIENNKTPSSKQLTINH